MLNSLPVPGLWLDIFQKVKALGFNTVSYYLDWALLEGKAGDFSADGVFALEPFYDAATAAGIYLIARPGPYINAEASGVSSPVNVRRFKLRILFSCVIPSVVSVTNNEIGWVSWMACQAPWQTQNKGSGLHCGYREV